MTTRLDRLVGLLDSGATSVVRATAARQIGGIQKQHPEELFQLLGRVYEFAIEAIAKEVPEWDPNSTTDMKPPPSLTLNQQSDVDEDVEGLLEFGQFNVDSVIKHGRLLLGSAGREYEDDGLQGLDPAARIAAQRVQMRKRLGIGAEFLGDDLLADEDLAAKPVVARPQPVAVKTEQQQHPAVAVGGGDEGEAAIDMSTLSARERNRLKRKARLDAGKNKKKSKADMSGNGSSGPSVEQAVVTEQSVTEQAGGSALVVEATRAGAREALFAISAGRWAFAGLVGVLSVDLFDATWEVRHGAGMALRSVLKHHGFGAGRRAGCSAAQNSTRNQRFLEDLCVRLCCVFALDRFGDFVADHVVAPVRETCAQALGAASRFAAQRLVQRTQEALLQLVERGSGTWEVRHAGLSALRYVVAVRKDLAPLLAGGALDAALGALRASDDDVRAVAAETLLPLADTLVTCQPHRLLDVVAAAWAALGCASDDLAAAAAAVLALLARLFAHNAVRDAVAHAEDPQFALSQLVPRLHLFMRHALAGVRRACLETLLAMSEMPGGVCSAQLLQLVYQNVLLETTEDIRRLSLQLWDRLLLQQVNGMEVEPRSLVEMFALAATPVGAPMPRNLLLDPLQAAAADLGLISRDTIVRCRVEAAAALGRLAASCASIPLRAELFGSLLLNALVSHRALEQQLAAVVAEEMAMAERPIDSLMLGEPFTAPQLIDQLRQTLQVALAREEPYLDTCGALLRVRSDCLHLLDLVDARQRPAVPEAAEFSMAFADALLAQTADVAALSERRLRLGASAEYWRQLHMQLDVAAKAALAGALVAMGRLPAKLNAILRSLMTAIKSEPCALLQQRAATAAARLAALCYCACDPPRAAPADKMVRNLATFACSDPTSTPVFAQRVSQTESILMLEMVQREQATAASSSSATQQQGGKAEQQSSGDASMAQAASASAQASHRKKRRGAAKGSTNSGSNIAAAVEEEEAVPLVAAVLSEEQGREQAARLIVRGAEAALSAIATLFGASLVDRVPRLWECVTLPLAQAYSADPDGADARFNVNAEAAQAVIDALRVLLTLAPALHPDLHGHLVATLPWAMRALLSRFSAIRHMAARTIAELCRVATTASMQAFIQTALPVLGESTRVSCRQGVAEAIYYTIQRLDDHILLPYVTFLMVPVLGRMSDSNEQTRLVCTNCFAQLIKLVPLEADIPDPPGISADLVAQREHERKFLAQLMDPTKLEPFRIPVTIKATLRKYQQEGVDWLAFLNKYELHGILCDDMGLGKTLQTICIVASDHHARRDKEPLPTLVVCPPTLIGHWEQEIQRYAENLRPLCYAGPPAERRPLLPRIQDNSCDVVIMSYDVVRNDIDLLSAINWNYCILDEGHVIKNARTKLTQAVKRVHARHRLILSGTPVQNNVIELWSLFDFLMPGFLGTERQFNEQYGKPILASRDAKQMSAQQVSGETALKQLHKQVLPFLLRRMKEDVLSDLPPKIIQDYYCELSPLQKFLYEEFAKSSVTGNLKKSLGMAEDTVTAPSTAVSTAATAAKEQKPATHVFQALQYLRKLCNHPALVLSPKHPLYNQVVADLRKRDANLHSLDIAPKMQALKDLLNQCGIGLPPSDEDIDVSASHRVLIFCQHREMIERIEQDLFQLHMPQVTHMRVDGTVEARRRQEIVTRFNADPTIDCLLLTTHVGGLGLNLTGADTVIFVEHDYNPAMDLQAMDRAHRLGQTKVVNVYRLITRNTLEEKIMGLQAFKLHMANTIVNQQNAGLASMNTDQLLDLFDVSPPKKNKPKDEGEGTKSMAKALEGLEDLWDTNQYEDEYNLDNFISSLQQ
ncbi:SNF2 family N-terminal domain-containing protein [Kickxella alabastrina]|uniref:SNF2 family N-terminal domain-containing protein n=1 Tax=Kickxella alabastrina TaxID=61397 RepID=UPI00221FBDCE|nr:SNF2 family N-terminal domain-containing protein [Kickxella alabastrina]KAI7824478.1 SNF2 family N-terminal domain-containing protein [Kickxella alabastrina]